MRVTKYYNSGKYKKIIVSLILIVCLSSNFIYPQSFTTITPINNSTGVATLKPQSKVWFYGGYWWAVIPVEAEGSDPAGTYLWRLDGTTLTKLMRLSDQSWTFADAKALGNVTHILVVQGTGDDRAINSAELVSIQFKDNSPSPPTYEPWTVRTSNVSITLDSEFDEAATIDIDSQGRMWLASDAKTVINVRWSDSDYSSWSSDIRLNTGHNITDDDICAVTAFDDNKIGVLWSNQSEDEFQFSYHLDSNNDASDWAAIETAADGNNIADDHINLAVHSSTGTIYAAVKTSASGGPQLALLVRNPATGSWSFHTVQNQGGTRPIALLNESENKIFVIYHPVGDGDILYKYSSLSPISFPSTASILDDRDNFQDITSTKQSFTDEVLILYNLDHSSIGGPAYWYGTKADASPFPVELSLFNAVLTGEKVALYWRTETEINNYGFEIERTININDNWTTIAFVDGNGNSNSPKYYDYSDYDIYKAGKYYYRLKQIDNDGTFEYSDIITVQVTTLNKFYLGQNYPNPFNPTTKIDFSLPERQMVSLRVYNILGKLVRELVDNTREPGSYSVTFDASKLPSGTYFYTILAGKYFTANKMSFIK
ncbi:MAG: T9SS type A sorting domain-containing protein [Ignavibacteria bacterium]|nr:T9SS type A sorting domain-containing protein [Ignavibacteria bacterium]